MLPVTICTRCRRSCVCETVVLRVIDSVGVRASSAMPVPTPHFAHSQLLVRCGLWPFFFSPDNHCFARGPEPDAPHPSRQLSDFSPSPLSSCSAAARCSPLHYVDDKHLLVTFIVHRLIPRLPDEPAGDQDRNVDAVLLELPSGKVLARTTWRLHDHAQYLWNLGHGHFLLRIRDTLTTFAPLANLSTGQPFAERPFLATPTAASPSCILSPDADLLIVETVEPNASRSKPDPNASFLGPLTSPAADRDETGPDQLLSPAPRVTTVVRSITPRRHRPVRNTGDIPATTAGYLAVLDQGHQHWAFDFHTYGGKVNELSPFDSTCRPSPDLRQPQRIRRLRLPQQPHRQQIGGFNMRGEEMWEQGLFGDYVSPSFAFAPASGRFALSRVILRTSAVADQPISADEVSTQTIDVYQTDTGKQLLTSTAPPSSAPVRTSPSPPTA